MTRVIGPRVGLGHEVALPFAILALCWLPVALGGVLWVGGHAASWLSGRGWQGPPFSVESASVLLDGGVKALWPGVSAALVWTTSGVVAAAVLAGVGSGIVVAASARAGEGRALASARDVAALTPKPLARRSVQLRPWLADAGRRSAPAEHGVLLGKLGTGRKAGPELRASWEDVVLAVMAPRAGKTTALAVPALLDAPGPVVATSNKADLWGTTARARAQQTGERVWVFDPQRITGTGQEWWWNPLRGMASVEEAYRVAGHFIQEVRGERGHRDFWTSAAHDLLTGLLLAAACSGRDLEEVYEWLNDPVLTTPVQVLRDHGHVAAAASLSGRQNGAPETRDGVYETARTAAQSLRDPAIMAWVTPSSRLEEFEPGRLIGTREALYLLSKDGAGAAGPLVAALTDRVIREAVRAAERAGGRLDPPMVVILDEAANVCRISDLPDLYSHLGSRGVLPITILQSYRQGVRVWGEHGMDTLWSAATCKLLGAGLDDPRLVEDVSRLVGEHDVAVRSVNRGSGRVGETVSLRRQRILPPERVRALAKGTALLLATGCRPALVTLVPWFAGPQAGVIASGAAGTSRNQ